MNAERVLVSKVAQNHGQWLNELVSDGIETHLFTDPLAGEIWQFMINHQQRFGRPPVYKTTLEEYGSDYNFERSEESVEYIKEKFLNQLERKEAMEFAQELARACNDPQYEGQLGEITVAAGQRISNMLPGSQVHRFNAGMMDRIKLYKEREAAGDYGGIEMGIPAIDKVTMGIQSHEFVTCVGWQGMGKSTLVQWMAWNFLMQNKSTLFISLEMSWEALMRKWDQMVNQFSSYSHLKSLNLSEQDLRKWEERAERFGRGDFQSDIIVLDDVRDCTVERVYSEIKRHSPDVVAIDYISLMHTPAMGQAARWEKLTWLSRQLKQTAISTKTPIVAVAQTDRSSAKTGAQLDNIGGSYSIGADSDIVLGLHQDDEMKEQSCMEVRLNKNRDGEVVNEKMYWDMQHMRFAQFDSANHQRGIFGLKSAPEPEQEPKTTTTETGEVVDLETGEVQGG